MDQFKDGVSLYQIHSEPIILDKENGRWDEHLGWEPLFTSDGSPPFTTGLTSIRPTRVVQLLIPEDAECFKLENFLNDNS